jgi:hypothetical protein
MLLNNFYFKIGVIFDDSVRLSAHYIHLVSHENVNFRAREKRSIFKIQVGHSLT